MNRIDILFKNSGRKKLGVYFTAGYPAKIHSLQIIKALQDGGADMIEVGMPFSDPLADGPVIQQSSMEALNSGMSIARLFAELRELRKSIHIPVVLMGYLNPVLQFGFEKVLEECRICGIDGIILPDLPVEVYEAEYKVHYERAGIFPVFLITPDTPEARREKIVRSSKGFVYLVSASSVTGTAGEISEAGKQKLNAAVRAVKGLPVMVGFGIHDAQSFRDATESAAGGIIGSAFIRLQKQLGSVAAVSTLIENLKLRENDYSIT